MCVTSLFGFTNMLLLLLLLLLFLVTCEGKETIDYDRWKLFQIDGFRSNPDESKFLFSIEDNKQLRVLEVTQDALRVAVSPDIDFHQFKEFIEDSGHKWTILHNNIGKLVKSSQKIRRSVNNGDQIMERYLPLDEMEINFKSIVEAHPDKIKSEVVGKSFEGRNIYLFTISGNVNSSLCLHPDKSQGSSPTIDSNRLELRKLPRRNRGLKTPIGNNILISERLIKGNDTHNVLFFNFNALKNRFKKVSEVLKTKRSKKPLIFIDAGLHSREWISPAAAIYLMKKLVDSPHLMANVDWMIMPMANPDGYVYSWDYDRFWRKTRSNSTIPDCFGADMNRNFGHRWGEVDTSTFPCSEHYGGSQASSEVETKILKEVLLKQKDRLQAYVSLHNWGQDILYPYIHAVETPPKNKAQLKRVGEKMVEAIKKAQGMEYKIGQGSQLLYPASGTSIDWAYDVLGVPLSYLIELRDRQGLLGFLLPDIFIQPTGEDLFAAMSLLASEVVREVERNCSIKFKK